MKTAKNNPRNVPQGTRDNVLVENLHFDTRNPRLVEYGVTPKTSQDDILEILWEKWPWTRSPCPFRLRRNSVIQTLAGKDDDAISAAFRCLLKNRVQRGGILAPGAGLLKAGENGKGLASRWYPETFAKRIEKIQVLRKRITFLEGDGLNTIVSFATKNRVAFFVDPPYFANGRGPGERLYRYNEVNHANLFSALSKSCGPCLMTYHNSRPVRTLAESHGFSCRNVRMKTAHHRVRNELLIFKPAMFKAVISSPSISSSTFIKSAINELELA